MFNIKNIRQMHEANNTSKNYNNDLESSMQIKIYRKTVDLRTFYSRIYKFYFWSYFFNICSTVLQPAVAFPLLFVFFCFYLVWTSFFSYFLYVFSDFFSFFFCILHLILYHCLYFISNVQQTSAKKHLHDDIKRQKIKYKKIIR